MSEAVETVRNAPGSDRPQQHGSAWAEDAIACFARQGALVIENAIAPSVISAALRDFEARYRVHMAPGQKRLYRRFQPDPLRAQIPVALDGPIADPALFAPQPAMELIRRLMGDKLIIGEMGAVISHPGAQPQDAHRDSAFLFGGLDMEIGLPPFAMTMLVPLRHIPLEMGPTEFWPGSHRVRDEAAILAEPPQRLALKAGSLILIDARTMHRGGANASDLVRPIVYFSFHRRWYHENSGYEAKPQVRVTPSMLHRLPKTHRPLFDWALHLNRTDSLSEFAYRWGGRLWRLLKRS